MQPTDKIALLKMQTLFRLGLENPCGWYCSPPQFPLISLCCADRLHTKKEKKSVIGEASADAVFCKAKNNFVRFPGRSV